MNSERSTNEQPGAAVEPQVQTAPAEPPPAYESCELDAQTAYQLPAYEDATKLPTYDEVEKCKADEANVILEPECPERAARQHQGLFLWSGTGFPLDSRRHDIDPSTMSHSQLKKIVLGNELEYLCCFLVTFLFNWIGLFACLCCLTVTIAGRAGAISGFGLSVIKWAFVVMHQSYLTRESLGLVNTTEPTAFLTDGLEEKHYSDEKWFTMSCWVIVILGILCFLQGVCHYVKAKKAAENYDWLKKRYLTQTF